MTESNVIKMKSFDVKIFGERNTGTNVLKKIVENNSRSSVLPSVSSEIDRNISKKLKIAKMATRPFGKISPYLNAHLREKIIDRTFENAPVEYAWKHTATTFESLECFSEKSIVFCIRNPMSWLCSLYKNPYHLIGGKPETFEEFIDMDWRLAKRDNLRFDYLKPYKLYEEKFRTYLDFMKQLDERKIEYRVVYFEQIVSDQSKVFGQIKQILRDPTANFQPTFKSTKSKDKDSEYYKNFYSTDLWKIGFENGLEKLDSVVDKELFKDFYDL